MGMAGIVGQAVTAGGTAEAGPVTTDPGARAVRANQDQAITAYHQQVLVMSQDNRAIAFRRDRHTASAQAIQDGIRRREAGKSSVPADMIAVDLTLHPGDGLPGWRANAGPMPVAAANRNSRRIPGQPPRKRRGRAWVLPA